MDDEGKALIEQLEAENARLTKELEKAREERDKFRLIEEASFEPVAVLDDQLRCLWVTNALLKIFKYNREEVVGASGPRFIAPECREKTTVKALSGHTEPYETTMLRSDGSPFPVIIQGINLVYQGKPVRVVAFRDITEIKKKQRELEMAYAELDTIFNHSMVAIFFLDGKRNIRRTNQRAADIFGYYSPEEIEGLPISVIHLSQEHAENFGKRYETILKKKGVVRVEHQLKRKDASIIWASIIGKAIDPAIPPDLKKGVIWIADDITRSRQIQLSLERANAELETFFANSMFGILMLRGGRLIYRVNQQAADIMGYDSPDEVVGKCVSEFHLSEEDYIQFGDKFYNSLVKKEARNIEWQVKRKDGAVIWILISGKAVDSADPPDLNKGVVWFFDDITKRKEAERKLIEIATIDDLTKTHNRRHFMELGKREFATHKRHGRPLSLLMLDIDHFKSINDGYGHETGDKALRRFAALCRKSLRSGDIFGRTGGEEFAIILPDTGIDQAMQAAERIRNAVETASSAPESEAPAMTVSIGVAGAEAENDLTKTLNQADKALYRAKESGRNRVVAYK